MSVGPNLNFGDYGNYIEFSTKMLDATGAQDIAEHATCCRLVKCTLKVYLRMNLFGETMCIFLSISCDAEPRPLGTRLYCKNIELFACDYLRRKPY